MLKMFNALPAYAGGKRRLLGAIFKTLPLPDKAPVFVDAFHGGGAVSLYAKARGYRVMCNDIAERSVIVGRALIENDHVTLSHEDLVRLSLPVKEPGYAETHLAPDVFPADHARFLDLVLRNADDMGGPKRWLARLLVVKLALRLRPMGNFGARTIMRQVAAEAWEEMNVNYLRDIHTRGLPLHPIRIAEKTRKQINSGVFSNGQENEVHQLDAFEFLAQVYSDVVYLDPPYSGTQSYERSLAPLDDLLRGGPPNERPAPNLFSTESPEQILPRLFEVTDHIPILVLSYGNKRIDLSSLMDLMRKFRPHVEGQAINYIHCTGLSGEESRRKNQELLVIGRK